MVRQAEERPKAGNIWIKSRHIFTSATGAPLDPANVLRAVRTAAGKAGLDGLTVHTLRHSAATAMLEAGVHIRGVSDLLGHADTRITAEIYAHTSDDVARAAMARLASAFL